MKLFYSYMRRLFAYIPNLSKVTRIPTTIFSPATKWHTLVNVRQAFLLQVFCFILFSDVHAQSAGERAEAGLSEIRHLQVGDTIPYALWQIPLHVVNHPDGKDTITLNDYRDRKLIILDFWATWCGSCIKSFPKMDSLNTRLQPDLQILLVNSITGTGDTNTKIKAFFDKLDYTLSIPSVINDSLFKKLFPRKLIPHYVWIDNNGKVKAITASKELTFENIERMIHNENVTLTTKEY
ncbi:TlpA family protein disulfide reductase [Sphingobacterium chuzhouense]|uniref:TlpA family protein disulfide reductase n=1 Tax=Sphingobacterium chuzhouense TaxID=1742264 RepID=A0ABR7XP98_9SPHI|nr:TlpA disulfide reductase family protein [Sphingobacterium chuzhouense]MBD1421001.1 TlpA family protein disulfide reductase [Sphingobacterium chuzhouense]